MGSTTGLRLLSGMALSVILARAMGVEGFGTLMGWFAVGGLFSLPVNYGMGPLILREAVRQDDQGQLLLRQALGLKVVIAVPVLMAAFAYGWWTDGPLLVLAVLLLTHMVDSCVDLFGSVLRANGHYATETVFATFQAVAQFGVIVAAVLVSTATLAVAGAFLLSRFMPLFLAVWAIRKKTGMTVRPCFRNVSGMAKLGFHYFVDNGLQTAIQFVDVVLLKALAGPVAVGNYQAGMKVVVGITQVINILVNATLPGLSRELVKTPVRWKHFWVSILSYGAIGALLSVPLFVFSQELAHLLFGLQFQDLPIVMKLLAIFLIVRFLSAGSGVLLAALGHQQIRSFAMLIGAIVLVTISQYLMRYYGAQGAALSVAVAYGVIGTILTIVLAVHVHRVNQGVLR